MHLLFGLLLNLLQNKIVYLPPPNDRISFLKSTKTLPHSSLTRWYTGISSVLWIPVESQTTLHLF